MKMTNYRAQVLLWISAIHLKCSMGRLRSSIIGGAPSSGGHVVSCSAKDVNKCAKEKRTCIRKLGFKAHRSEATRMNQQYCGECLNGFIPSLRDNTICTAVGDISYPDFVEVFHPTFLENLSDNERLKNLRASASFISFHNSAIPPPSVTLAINDLAAHSARELIRCSGYRDADHHDVDDYHLTYPSGGKNHDFRGLESLPNYVNWVEKGVVSSVKHQKICACCWGIAALGAIEGKAAIESNFTYLQSLSVQQLISCDKQNNGCEGGLPSKAIDYCAGNTFGGMTSEDEYPFTDAVGNTTEACLLFGKHLAAIASEKIAVTTPYTPFFYPQRFEYIKMAVTQQPISTIMRAGCDLFQFYSSGVLTDDGSCSCSSVQCLDHAVLIVGYDDEADVPYWLIKNSWGTGWGEQGYFRIAQTASNSTPWGLFGILSQGTLPGMAYFVTTNGTKIKNVLSSPSSSAGNERWCLALALALLSTQRSV